jgi:hypothetical protein
LLNTYGFSESDGINAKTLKKEEPSPRSIIELLGNGSKNSAIALVLR